VAHVQQIEASVGKNEFLPWGGECIAHRGKLSGCDNFLGRHMSIELSGLSDRTIRKQEGTKFLMEIMQKILVRL